MYVLVILGIIYILVPIIKALWRGDKGKKEIASNDVLQIEEPGDMKKNEIQLTNEGVQVEIGTRDLLLHVLGQIGCQYTIDEEKRILFNYQGERFFSDASNECPCFTIYDCWWEQCELHDVEQMARIKQAMNEANCRTHVTTFYSVDEAGGTMGIHSTKNILFIPSIPNIEGYLRATLDEFFSSHRFMALEMERLQKEGK